MSPELETLDQLLGGEMPLAVICGLFNDDERFARAVLAMLHAGEVRLDIDGNEAPHWRWVEVLTRVHHPASWATARLGLTKAGVRRIGG